MTTAASPESSAPAAAPTPAPAAPARMTANSLMPDMPPAQRQAPAAPAQAAAQPGQPAADGAQSEPKPYEDPRLEKVAGGKYRTFEDVDKTLAEGTSALHKEQQRAKALEMRLGQFKGPPVGEDGKPRPYNFAPREGSPFGEIDPTAPEFETVQKIAAKYGAPEGMIQELFTEIYEPLLEGNAEGLKEIEHAELVDYAGTPEAAVELKDRLGSWLVGQLGEDQWAQIRRGITSTETLKMLDMLTKKLDSGSLPNPGNTGEQSGDTWPTILKMQADNPNWRTDPVLTKRFDKFTLEEAARRDAEAASRPQHGGVLAEMAQQQRR